MTALRVLDFDIETRKIGFHIGGKFNPDGCEPIAIAWSWGGAVRVRQLGVDDPLDMLRDFVEAYTRADVATGHYIRKFDLPIINGALIERGMAPLPPKMTSDTKSDLISRAGWSSSQENLAAMLHLLEDKYHMNDHLWREATRLTPRGIRHTRRRVRHDVVQHMSLRATLVRRGLLGRPRMWP